MATRPIFIVESNGPTLVREKYIDFKWHAGMSKPRKQMSVRSLHMSTQKLFPKARILEASRMSDNPLGEQLSAFNLTFVPPTGGKDIPVECAFQASKVFDRGGPYTDLLDATPVDAKRDPRLQVSGRLKGFCYFGEAWDIVPPTAFYDWIYVCALQRRPDLVSSVTAYDIFTDIAFNPKKSINCQANALALYVALARRGEIEAALSSRDAFIGIVSGAIAKDDNQRSLF